MKKESRWYSFAQESDRTKINGEVFTPARTSEHLVDVLVSHDNTLIYGNFLDPSCGDGNILLAVLARKIESGVNPLVALETIFGIELMQDNVDRCRLRLAVHVTDRLYVEGDDYDEILKACYSITGEPRVSASGFYPNIVCHDTLTWDATNWRPIEDQPSQPEFIFAGYQQTGK